jgi:hypothetical protein
MILTPFIEISHKTAAYAPVVAHGRCPITSRGLLSFESHASLLILSSDMYTSRWRLGVLHVQVMTSKHYGKRS